MMMFCETSSVERKGCPIALSLYMFSLVLTDIRIKDRRRIGADQAVLHMATSRVGG
jgi:hypothetical protein